MVCHTVYVSRLYIVLKRLKISTWFLSHATCLSQIMLEFGLHQSTPSSPNFVPKWPTASWLEHRWHLTANCNRVVRDSAMSQCRAYRKLPSLYRVTPTDLPFHQNGARKCTSQGQLHDACCHLANMIEDIDKAAECSCRMSLLAEQHHLMSNYFGTVC